MGTLRLNLHLSTKRVLFILWYFDNVKIQFIYCVNGHVNVKYTSLNALLQV